MLLCSSIFLCVCLVFVQDHLSLSRCFVVDVYRALPVYVGFSVSCLRPVSSSLFSLVNSVCFSLRMGAVKIGLKRMIEHTSLLLKCIYIHWSNKTRKGSPYSPRNFLLVLHLIVQHVEKVTDLSRANWWMRIDQRSRNISILFLREETRLVEFPEAKPNKMTKFLNLLAIIDDDTHLSQGLIILLTSDMPVEKRRIHPRREDEGTRVDLLLLLLLLLLFV